jgi:hypothetical protein
LRRFYALTRALRLLPIGILAPTVLPALTPSTITLIASPNASQFGQAVILTATVTAGATGKVTFYDDVTVLGAAKLAAGQATLTSAALPSGGTMLRAYYNGDNSYSPSISALVPQTVTAGISLGLEVHRLCENKESYVEPSHRYLCSLLERRTVVQESPRAEVRL